MAHDSQHVIEFGGSKVDEEFGPTVEAKRREVLAKLARRRRNSAGLVAYLGGEPVGFVSLGPRSDFAGFGVKKVPYLFFTHATHKDYHGEGDTADRV